MMERFLFEVVTPTRLLVSEEAELVVIPGGDGDFGILPGHAPLLSTIRPGTVAIYENDKIRERLFVEGGFAEVSDGRCTVVAQMAVPVPEIDKGDVERRIDVSRRALESSDSFEDRKAHGRELETAEAMLAAVKAWEEEKKRY